MDNQKFVHGTELSGGNYGPRVIKDNNNLVTANNGNVVPNIHAQREIQKMMSSAGVHFTANKDSFPRHFNKFGDVLKVVIPIGQPKGVKAKISNYMLPHYKCSWLINEGI